MKILYSLLITMSAFVYSQEEYKYEPEVNKAEYYIGTFNKGKNVEDLSEKIIKISKDEKLRKKIGKKGRDKYLKYFNSTLVADFIINKTLSIKSKKKYLWFNGK